MNLKLKKVKAVSYVREIKSGKSRPVLMCCEDDDGENYDIVVKINDLNLMAPDAPIFEFMASFLACDLGLLTPRTFVVELEEEFTNSIINPELKSRIKKSDVLNFGSEFIGPENITWPSEKELSGNLFEQAVRIFSFDAFIQNPDRRKNNPNLFIKKNQLYVYDHETAFSFIYDILPNSYNYEYLREHVFYSKLKRKELNLEEFIKNLERIDENRLLDYYEVIPDFWKQSNKNIEKILNYIKENSNNSDKITSEIWRILK